MKWKVEYLNRRNVAIAVAVLVGYLALVKLGVVNALIAFLLVGAIPGTNVNVPSSVMLLVMIVAMWLIIFRFAALKTLHRQATERKKTTPKRRFEPVHDSAS